MISISCSRVLISFIASQRVVSPPLLRQFLVLTTGGVLSKVQRINSVVEGDALRYCCESIPFTFYSVWVFRSLWLLNSFFMVFWSTWPLNFFHGFFGPYDLKTQTSGWIDSGQISQCGCCAAAVLNHEDLLVLTLTFPPSFFLTSCLREVLYFQWASCTL